jgi:hypothetical protein
MYLEESLMALFLRNVASKCRVELRSKWVFCFSCFRLKDTPVLKDEATY